MIPDLQAALVCEDVRFETSGANTLVGVVQVVHSPHFPLRILKLCVFTRWISGIGNFQQTTRLLDPDENTMNHTETAFALSHEDKQATNIAVFGGVEFKHPGSYSIEILLDQDLILRLPLPVVGPKQPGPH